MSRFVGIFIAIALVAGALADHSLRDPVSRGLIHWWKFDGNANDYAGNLNAAPIGPVSYVPAVLGLGIAFDGANTGISLPPSPDLQFQGSFSISAWVCLSAYAHRDRLWSTIIFEGDDRPGLDPFDLQVSPWGNLQFLTTSAKRALGATSPGRFPLHLFVLVTGTYDQAHGLQSLYENASLVAQNKNAYDLTPVCPLADSERPGVGIGTNNAFPKSVYNMGWDGIIEDLRIYNRALLPREVRALYNMRLSR